MSSAAIAPVTARGFLFGASGVDTANALGRVLRERGVGRSALERVQHLSGAAKRTVDDEIGTVADGLLDRDRGEVLVAGWRSYAAVTESARRTLATPGSEEVLALATHRITSTLRPQVDLFINDRKVKTLEFELNIIFDVTGLSAVVKAGDLVALRGGECRVTAALTLEGGLLAERKRSLDLALTVPLDPAVPLVDKPGPPQPG